MTAALVEEFKALTKDRPAFDNMIDHVTETSYGLSYVFDGYIGCAIVLHDGKFIDAQDVNLEEPMEDVSMFAVYDSLEAMVRSWELEYEKACG